MGKRLTRIFGKDFPSRAKELIATELHIVFKNKSTLHGTLVAVEASHFILRDMKLINHKLNSSDIEEVIFDREAAY